MIFRTLLIGATVTLVASFAVYAASAWRVAEVAGKVIYGGPGLLPSPPTPSATFAADGTWLETGDGTVTIIRGSDEVSLRVNSRIMITEPKASGEPSFLQSRGTVDYVDNGPSLVIATPYLDATALRKAKFRVQVGDSGASVAVTMGSVKVTKPDDSEVATVTAGNIAKVTGSGRVVIEKE